MPYLLDNNVLSYFLNRGRAEALSTAAVRTQLVIVDEVREEAERHRTLGGFFRDWLPTTRIQVRPIEVGSLAHHTLVALSPDLAGTKDKGERASLALASVDDTLTFVANDKNALWLALRELHVRGERILGIPVFLRRLRDDAGLDRESIDDVMAASTCPVPTWWNAWRASLRAP